MPRTYTRAHTRPQINGMSVAAMFAVRFAVRADLHVLIFVVSLPRDKKACVVKLTRSVAPANQKQPKMQTCGVWVWVRGGVWGRVSHSSALCNISRLLFNSSHFFFVSLSPFPSSSSLAGFCFSFLRNSHTSPFPFVLSQTAERERESREREGGSGHSPGGRGEKEKETGERERARMMRSTNSRSGGGGQAAFVVGVQKGQPPFLSTSNSKSSSW